MDLIGTNFLSEPKKNGLRFQCSSSHFFSQINLEKAESAYYLYRNWSKSGLPPKKPENEVNFFLWKKIQFIHVFGCFLSYYNIVVVSIFFVKINIWGSDKKQEVVIQVYFVWVFPISFWRNSYVNKQKLSQVYLV